MPWLESRGYSRTLLSRYAAAGWLVQPARGVYHRPGFRLSWQGVVTSLQSLLGYRLSVGGKTALQLHGHGYYISARVPHFIHLYGPKAPPGWLHKLNLDQRFVFHKAERLFPPGDHLHAERQLAAWDSATQRFSSSAVLPEHAEAINWGEKDMPLIVSRRERAALEHLDDIPARSRFDDVGNILENLVALDPKVAGDLLRQCRSIKVKRLFLWFAERHGQPWFGKIDLKQIDLGRGKRALVKEDGCFDAKYQITYPQYMLYDEMEEDDQ